MNYVNVNKMVQIRKFGAIWLSKSEFQPPGHNFLSQLWPEIGQKIIRRKRLLGYHSLTITLCYPENSRKSQRKNDKHKTRIITKVQVDARNFSNRIFIIVYEM